MDLARAEPLVALRLTARKKGSGYENGVECVRQGEGREGVETSIHP